MLSLRAWPMGHRYVYALCPYLVALMLLPGAYAGISQNIFAIQASNTEGSATYTVDYSAGNWDPVAQRYNWQLSGALPLMNGSATIATLDSASLTIDFLPYPTINLSFGVGAGADDTTFTLDTAVVDFGAVTADVAAASFSAGCTVTESGAQNGVWFYEPHMTGHGVFEALYNTNPPPETLFSHLLAMAGSNAGGSATASEMHPATGFLALGNAAYDMTVRANFILTAADSADASAVFTLVPEPSALTLALSLTTLFAMRRRNGC